MQDWIRHVVSIQYPVSDPRQLQEHKELEKKLFLLLLGEEGWICGFEVHTPPRFSLAVHLSLLQSRQTLNMTWRDEQILLLRKLPVQAADQRNLGNWGKHPSIGCFAYIGLNFWKIPLFPSTAEVEPATCGHQEPSHCISPGRNCRFQPAWVAVRDLGWQTAQAAPTPPQGKQEGARSQKCQQGNARASAGRRLLPSKGALGRELWAANISLEGDMENGWGRTVQGCLSYCLSVHFMCWGSLEVLYMQEYFWKPVGCAHWNNKCINEVGYGWLATALETLTKREIALLGSLG